MVEAIDAKRNASDGLKKLRGNGAVGDPDTMYGSITHVPAENETLVGLQNKFLFMQNLLQAADVAPTNQTRAAIVALNETLSAVKARYDKLK